MTATRECEHGLPPGCPLHRPSRAPGTARRVLHVAVIATLALLDVAALAAVAWGLLTWLT